MKYSHYQERQKLDKEHWNNGLSWRKRRELWSNCTLYIPSLIDGNLSDVVIGEDIVFEEIENDSLLSCRWLKNFVRFSYLDIPVVIFDNHNHALYFWVQALREGVIEKGCELIHMDEHSDLWENTNTLDLKMALDSDNYSWEFTNHFCNVWNYILPALESGIIWKLIRLENEFQIDEYMNTIPEKNSILNLDLDIFAPEMDFISESKKLSILENILPRVQLVTIATSPFFIDQNRAIEKLCAIFHNTK